MIIFRMVPIPGVSLIGIHRNITARLTRKVASPIVQTSTVSAIPSAKTVQGVFPTPAAIRSESPSPKMNSPIIRMAIVDRFGFNDFGFGELHQTVGTFLAGRRISASPMLHDKRLTLEPSRSILS
mgnify:CR=1 FL=1